MTLVITGASSGIGGRIYKDMCEVVSDKVICISRNKPEQLADKDEWLKCDLSKSEEVDTLIETLTKEKKIEKLIHCAGVMETRAATKIDYKLAERMFNINITAPLAITSRLTKQLSRANGSVVFVSSIAADIDIEGEISYSISKEAVLRMCRGFNAELNRLGIKYFAVCPSLIDTPMTNNLEEEKREFLLKKQTSKGELDLAKIASLIINISDMPSEFSGTVFKAKEIKK